MKRLLAVLAISGFPLPALAEAPAVVTSIKPVHSLVSAVMAGVGEPALLVQGGQSEHTASLRPSDARALAGADLVVWVGPYLESFLAGPIDTVAADARVLTLSEAPGILELPFREGGAFEAHDHGEEESHDHDHAADDEGHSAEEHEHAADAHADGHEHAHEHGHDDHGHDGHDHGAVDMHLWLDPSNAEIFVHEIAEALAALDPGNAAAYRANAEATEARIRDLDAEIAADLAPLAGRSFIVFHDGYQYFEQRYGVTAAGSVTVSPEILPGAARLAEIREKVAELGVSCVFSEPQFQSSLIDVVLEGSSARTGVLDTLGTDIADGPDLYFELMRRNAAAFEGCLSLGG